METGLLTCWAEEAWDAILEERWRVEGMLIDEAVDRQPFQRAEANWFLAVYISRLNSTSFRYLIV